MGWNVIYNWFAKSASRAYQYTFWAKIRATFRKHQRVHRKEDKRTSKLRDEIIFLQLSVTANRFECYNGMHSADKSNYLVLSCRLPSSYSRTCSAWDANASSNAMREKSLWCKTYSFEFPFNLSQLIKFMSSSCEGFVGWTSKRSSHPTLLVFIEPATEYCSAVSISSARWALWELFPSTEQTSWRTLRSMWRGSRPLSVICSNL